MDLNVFNVFFLVKLTIWYLLGQLSLLYSLNLYLVGYNPFNQVLNIVNVLNPGITTYMTFF
jgi:hypothetical protein